MAYKKRAPRRYVRKRNRFYRRKKIAIRRPRNAAIYNFRQVGDLANIAVAANAQTNFFAYNFSLNEFSNTSTFTALYDVYRICAIKVIFSPPFSTSYATPSAFSVQIPTIYTVIDYDDAVVPTTQGQLDAYQSLKVRYFNRPHVRYFKPKYTIVGLARGAGTVTNTGQLTGRKGWINCANNDVNYNGIKGSIVYTNSNMTSATSFVVRVTGIVYVQFKYTI